MLRGNPLPGGASAQLVRRDILNSVGGFDTKLHHIADWDLWIRLTEQGALAAVHEPLVAYRFHNSNMSIINPDKQLRELAHVAAKHAATARERGVSIDGVGFNHWLASSQRRAGHNWSAARLHFNAAIKYKDIGHLASAVRSPLGNRALGRRSPPASAPIQIPDWLQELRAPEASCGNYVGGASHHAPRTMP
jgi:hypothetical protein